MNDVRSLKMSEDAGGILANPQNKATFVRRMLLARVSSKCDVEQTLVAEASHFPHQSSRFGDYVQSLAATSDAYPSYSSL